MSLASQVRPDPLTSRDRMPLSPDVSAMSGQPIPRSYLDTPPYSSTGGDHRCLVPVLRSVVEDIARHYGCSTGQLLGAAALLVARRRASGTVSCLVTNPEESQAHISWAPPEATAWSLQSLVDSFVDVDEDMASHLPATVHVLLVASESPTQRHAPIEVRLGYDITVTTFPAPGSRKATDERLFAHQLALVLQQLTSGRSQRTGDVRLEDQAAAAKYLAVTDKTAALPLAESVTAVFDWRVALNPQATALVDENGEMSNAELYETYRRVAGLLHERGIRTSDHVVLAMEAGRWHIAALLACWHLGCVPIPVGTHAGQAIWKSLGTRLPRLVICETDRVFNEDHLSASRLSLEGLAAADATCRCDHPVTPAEAPAYVCFTSGTTGNPKAVVQPHEQLVLVAQGLADLSGLTRDSRLAQWARPGYDAAIVEVAMAALTGATLYIPQPKVAQDPRRLSGWLTHHKITHLQTVPSFARFLATVWQTAAAPELCALLLSGERLTEEVTQSLQTVQPGLHVINLYGSTETILATANAAAHRPGRAGSVGVTLPGRQVLVVNAAGSLCAPGEIGEVVVRAAGAPLEGTRELEISAALGPAVNPDARLYLTGDLGTRDTDDQLWILGRRDRQLKFNGVRLNLERIDALALELDAVGECLAQAVETLDGRILRIELLLVLNQTMTDGAFKLLTRTIREHLRREMGTHLPPVTAVRANSVPRSLGGKVTRSRTVITPTP